MDDDQRAERERRRRNVALALALGALVVLFFVLTIVRLWEHVLTFFQ
jgi:predicted nucleic acid-binding Zn ribbon protein